MNTGVGRHSLLQEIFPTQGSNPHLLHCRQILYHLSHQGSPYLNKAIIKRYQPFCTSKANNNNNRSKFVLIRGDHFLCLQFYCSLIKLPTSAGSWKKQESSRKTSISALLTMPKPLTVWITINWKILKEMGISDHLTCLLWNLYAVRKQQLELDMEQQTSSK